MLIWPIYVVYSGGPVAELALDELSSKPPVSCWRINFGHSHSVGFTVLVQQDWKEIYMSRLYTRFITFISLIVVASLFSGVVLAVDLEMADSDTYVEPSLVLPVAEDLEVLGLSSRKKMVPILIMYSTEDCVYCARLESEVLGPMRLSGADPEKVIVRKVLMEDYETLRDFSGKKRNAESYAIGRGVEIVPTVVLVDENGNELVPKIVGYQTPGIYDTYLEKAIEVSQILLEQR